MENKELIKIGTVIESASNSIMIRIENDEIFEKNKQEIQIGKYLQIKEGNHNYVICVIQSIKINDDNKKYIINSQPIGVFSEDFKQGSSILPSPTEEVFIISEAVMSKIFSKDSNYSFKFGELIQNRDINLHINGNRFFSKHIAVVGSTGSGKSCTVAKILQDVVGINKKTNLNNGSQKNAHVIIFDIHSEYKSAFEIESKENFNLNALDVDKLKLPYWLMNSEELESLFIESNEQNSHNQVSQFKKAVTLNKEKYNPSFKNVNYDTPVYFSIQEVYNFICNKNNLTTYNKEDKILLATLAFEKEYSENELWELISFEASTGNGKHAIFKEKVAKFGGFNGEFERFISRLETKINDKRLDFLLNPIKTDKTKYTTDDFEEILKQFLGYLDKSNITIIDLSGIPFEVLSITVSLISRLVFDFAFHYSKLRHSTDELNDIPFLLVCEEAHNYIPKSGGSEYKASKKSIERIAKEGRKYGLSLMVVSQRPSEVSDTIFSQCNNFVALRLTNISDQNYIKGLLPNNANSITDILPTLSAGECLIVGDATPMPAIVQMEMPDPEPKSESIKFHSQWENEWKEITFSEVITRWRKE
jgi:DNA helicase HerA-like ATPase